MTTSELGDLVFNGITERGLLVINGMTEDGFIVFAAGVVYSDTITVNGDGAIVLTDAAEYVGSCIVNGNGTIVLSDAQAIQGTVSLAGDGTPILSDVVSYSDSISVNATGEIVSIDFSAALEGVALILTSTLMDKVYVDQIRYLVKLDCGEDVSAATTQYISVRKPDGTVTDWTALVAEDNYIQHSTDIADIDQDGTYRVQAVVVLDGKTLLGNTDRFTIHPNHG